MDEMVDGKLQELIQRGTERYRISKEDCVKLMSYPEDSEEAGFIIDSAKRFVMNVTDGQCEIGAQIGIIIGPCYADCGFCTFAASTTDIEDYTMKDDELSRYLHYIADEGIVTSVSLMTIQNCDFGALIHSVELARSILPESMSLAVNTGDLEEHECRELRSAGVDSAYHALRLDESIVNMLEPIDRSRTMKNLMNAGIRVISGVEPIGPEHSANEICDLYWKAYNAGCSACSASAREPVPGTRLFGAGTISKKKLEQIRSSLLLSSTWCDRTGLGFYGGYYGGFDKAFAEYAGSPKDTLEISERNLGRTVEWARKSLKEYGFRYLKVCHGDVITLLR